MASTADIRTPAAVALPTVSLLALLLNVPPLVWHIKNRNVAACNLIVYTIFMNLCNFVNAVIWPTDDVYSWFSGAVLCDIEVKLLLASTFGIAGSLACIMRALANVLDTERTTLIPTKQQRRIEVFTTAALCFGGPLYAMVIHYVVQPSRYYILAIVGCTPSLDNSWPTIALIAIWPVVLCLAATYYGLVVIVRMRNYRREFSSILTASTSNLTKSRFLRLFFLSSSLVLIFLPLQFYVLSLNLSTALIPYSWDLVHNRHAWMDIIMLPMHGFVSIDRWVSVIVGILVFLFFGLGSDATKMYRKWWLKVRLGTNFSAVYGQSPALSTETSNVEHGKGSLASLCVDLCKKTFSRRRSSSTLLDKDDTATILTSPTSSFDGEKFPLTPNRASTMASLHLTQPTSIPVPERPLPPVPAPSRPSSFKYYFTQVRDFAPSDDIESALQRHEDYRPNRFIAGLWHANNAGYPNRIPAVHGVCMGTPNGLRY